MGNSTSQRSISVVNDNLVSSAGEVPKSVKTSTVLEKPRDERIFVNREEKRPKEVYATQQEEFQAALEPFNKLANDKKLSPEMPIEQKVMLECFKKNPKSSLNCSGEVNSFINYVNKVPSTLNSP